MKRKQIMKTLLIAGAIMSMGAFSEQGGNINKALNTVGIECHQEANASVTSVKKVYINSIEYSIMSDNTVKISAMLDRNKQGNLILESRIEGKPVTEIGESVFRDCTGIKLIEIPETVSTIGKLAFYGCNNLTSVSLPLKVKRLEGGVFEGCNSLKSLTLNKGLEYIDESISDTRISNLTIPETVEDIDCDFLKGSSVNVLRIQSGSVLTNLNTLRGVKLNTLIVESPLTYVYNNKDLSVTNLVIPDKDVVGKTKFNYTNLYSYETTDYINNLEINTKLISAKSPRFTVSKTNADNREQDVKVKLEDKLDSYECYYTLDGSEPVVSDATDPTKPTKKLQGDTINVIAPDTDIESSVVVSVKYTDKNYADSSTVQSSVNFGYKVKEEDGLKYHTINGTEIVIDRYTGTEKELVIPSEIKGYKVSEIEHGAFSNCSSLESVTLPDSIKSIEYDTFSDCLNLKNIAIPNSIIDIEIGSFSDCTSLEKVRIPDSVKAIKYNTFSGCTSLKDIIIPNSVKSIERYAFKDCINISKLVLPTSLEKFSLESTVGSKVDYIELPESVNTITDSTMADNIKVIKMSKETCLSTNIPRNGNKVYLVDEDEATQLGSYLVKQGTNLSQYLDTPVKYGSTFDKWAKSSTSSTSVIGNIQDTCTFIASYTAGSLNLPSPTLQPSETTAQNRDGSVTVKVGDMKAGLNYVYTVDGTEPKTTNGFALTGDTINIPKQDVDTEKIVTVKVAATMKGVYSSTASTSITFLAGTISNDPEYTEDGIVYSIHTNGTATVKKASGKTGNVVIPYEVNGNKITEIGQASFKDCVGMTSVNIPNTVATLGSFAFKGCTGLTSIDIPQSISMLNGGTFSGCTSLVNVKLPDSIITMQQSEFEGCNSLEIIKANSSMLNKIRLSGFNKVRFIEDDEATFLGGWYVKSGTSMIGKQIVPTKANYTFNKWTKYTYTSNSVLGDIEDNVTFEAVYTSTPGTPGEGQLKKALLTPSKSQAKNREIGVTITAK